MDSFESIIKESKHAMVIGVGGGGDIVGTISTSRYLRWLGLKTLIGGLTWERYVNDPEPGPRKMGEIVEIELISATVGLANEKTRTTNGVRFTESAVAGLLKENTLLVDLNNGVQGVIDGLNEAIEKLGVDLFMGIDVGGDVLAGGSEPGIHSMMADSMMLSAMANLKVPAVLGVLGCCMDGELTFEEFNNQLAKVASHGGLLGGWGLTREDVRVIEEILPHTKTEASALAVKSARGIRGEVEIRGGYCRVNVTPISAMTFFIDPKVVYDCISKVAKDLITTGSLDEAQSVLERFKLPSELTFERNFAWKKYADNDKLMDKGRK